MKDGIISIRNCPFPNTGQSLRYEHLPQTNTLFELMKALKFSEEEIKEFWNEYQKAYLADTELQRKREEDLATIS